MDQYELIRTAHRVYEKSIREIRRETGHHRKTIRKALAGVEPKYRRQKDPSCPVMDAVSSVIEKWLTEDQDRPRKQRHTAARVYRRLVEEQGFKGGESTVRRWVREWKASHGEGGRQAVIPLDPEVAREAEVDWGSGVVILGGEKRRVKLFCMRSRFSGKPFVRAYPWERQEMFLDGHIHAFQYYGGVFPTLVYDNLTTAVRRILRGRKRIEQESFVKFRSYYTFQARFCNPARGQEKGGVEGLIGYVRRNFLVPLPEVEDFEELNRYLVECCEAFGERKISGRPDPRTVDERHKQEREGLLMLPPRVFDNRKVVPVKVSRYQTATVDRNYYSVPSSQVGRWIWAHIGCSQVEFYADQKQLASHRRLFSNCQWQLDPLHYLDRIEQRVASFECARPIRQWRVEWPQPYEVMLEGLRQRLGESKGTREFVRILQLHGRYPKPEVEKAIEEAVQKGVYSWEAVRHLLNLNRKEEIRWQALPSDLLPGITDRGVPPPEIHCYNDLLMGGGQ
jgi:transposase